MAENEPLQPPSSEDRRNRKSFLIFLLIPLMIAIILCASQAGLLLSQIKELNVHLGPEETADYGPWPRLNIAPVDPEIIANEHKNQC